MLSEDRTDQPLALCGLTLNLDSASLEQKERFIRLACSRDDVPARAGDHARPFGKRLGRRPASSRGARRSSTDSGSSGLLRASAQAQSRFALSSARRTASSQCRLSLETQISRRGASFRCTSAGCRGLLKSACIGYCLVSKPGQRLESVVSLTKHISEREP